jgi:hypothetical protein
MLLPNITAFYVIAIHSERLAAGALLAGAGERKLQNMYMFCSAAE